MAHRAGHGARAGYSASARASTRISPSSSMSTCSVIGRQQTWQSSMYSWRRMERSMRISSGSPQEGQSMRWVSIGGQLVGITIRDELPPTMGCPLLQHDHTADLGRFRQGSAHEVCNERTQASSEAQMVVRLPANERPRSGRLYTHMGQLEDSARTDFSRFVRHSVASSLPPS